MAIASPDKSLQRDLAACRMILKRQSRSFFAASCLLPARVRAPATALYAFCRVADDAVDGPCAAGAIQRLERRLHHAYSGRPDHSPVDRAFAWAVSALAIPRAVPDALLEGFAWDEGGRRYESAEDLEAYAVRVAGTVGVMMSLVMGVREPRALARAIDLGVAMQLTNIARDIGEDARCGRLYLPLDWMEEAGLCPQEMLESPSPSRALGRVTRRLLAAAEHFYRRSEAGIAALPRDCRPAIMAARLVYAAIGAEIARSGHDSVTTRAVVPGRQKAALLARAYPASLRL